MGGRAAGDFNLLDKAAPDTDHPGWFSVPGGAAGRGFGMALGPFLFRPDGPGRGACRIFPTEEHLNPGGSVNGGAVLTLIDWALVAGGLCAGLEKGQYVTLELHNQFVARASAGIPLDALVILVKQTRSIAFLQGTCVQGEEVCSSWTGTLKRVRPQQ